MDKKGRIITEETAYARVTRLCSQKECAPSDIARKLRGMDLPEPTVEKIINRLKKENYINEKRFIRSYIHDKVHFNKWGRKKIELSLKQKQLSGELIEEAFRELPDDIFGESLKPILERKWKSVTGKTDYEKRTKLIRYALGRGFLMEEVMTCINQMETGGPFNEPDEDFR